ncbi:hypothetical protein [Pseudomonas aeruginosa]|uniref:hypothetical protein n=1 Tax=Pseudomonas aeruginosa TaxID=287 RepID=UPI002936C65A|nr:hypothetical protein [Pseudomonas aeruginosa]MDV2663564.1 hypothetical protein [Pseudomonas aeruginosa]
MSIDWSKAPEGCIGAFARIIGNQRTAFFVFSKRPSDYMSREGYEGEGEDGSYHVFSEFWEWLDKPWDGQGLPPVGIECEFSMNTGSISWAKGRVIGHDGVFAVISHNGKYYPRNEHGVRPIRTPEQIAAEARDNATTAWLNKIAREYDQHTAAKCEHILIGAGYRRQEEGK